MTKSGAIIEQSKTANRLVIHQKTDSSQMLVKLCRNDAIWLSPVGWKDQEKGTLLDCHPSGGSTELIIPDSFARDIAAGDKIRLYCPELALTGELEWHDVEPAAAAPVKAKAAPARLSLFARKKAPEPISDKSETEIRAEEAERVASEYRAKMEAAAAAKEAAQRKALDAAREAENALKQEVARIAEMERAAIAFEEAESLKQDEMRRVEDERRVEEERLAEEARLIEAARQREITARKEAARKTAITRYYQAIEVTQAEQSALSSRLDQLMIDAQTAQTEDALRLSKLEDIQIHETRLTANYNQAQTALENAKASLQAAEHDTEQARLASDDLYAENMSLEKRVSDAQFASDEAQRAADAAIVLAQEKRTELQSLTAEKAQIGETLADRIQALEVQMSRLSQQQNTTNIHRDSHDVSLRELTELRADIDVLKADAQRSREATQSLDMQIEATRQALGDVVEREADHRRILQELHAGADPDVLLGSDTPALDIAPAAPAAPARALLQSSTASTPELFAAKRERNSQSLRSKLSLPKFGAPNLSLPAMSLPAISAPKVSAAQGAGLLAIAAVIGVGSFGAYNYTKSLNAPTPVATVAKPDPSDVASAVIAAQPDLDGEAFTRVNGAELDAEAASKAVQPLKVESLSAAKPQAQPLDNQPVDKKPAAKKPAIKMPETSSKRDAAIIKSAAVIPPEAVLPRPKPISRSVKAAPAKTQPKKVVKTPKPAPKKSTQSQSETEVTNYPELTKDVQTRLRTLGFYNGPIDGLQNAQTIAAIMDFNSLFGLGEDPSINGPFLRELRLASTAEAEPSGLMEEPEPIAPTQTASLTQSLPEPASGGGVEIFPAPTTPVYTDTLSAAQPMSTQSEAALQPAYGLPVATQTDVIQDAMFQSKQTLNYPDSAVRLGLWVTADVELSYDVNASGRPTNIRVLSNSYDGRSAEVFEVAAIQSIMTHQYTPKQVNGEAALSEGHVKRITFSAE